jgi:hypothetical protein
MPGSCRSQQHHRALPSPPLVIPRPRRLLLRLPCLCCVPSAAVTTAPFACTTPHCSSPAALSSVRSTFRVCLLTSQRSTRRHGPAAAQTQRYAGTCCPAAGSKSLTSAQLTLLQSPRPLVWPAAPAQHQQQPELIGSFISAARPQHTILKSCRVPPHARNKRSSPRLCPHTTSPPNIDTPRHGGRDNKVRPLTPVPTAVRLRSGSSR